MTMKNTTGAQVSPWVRVIIVNFNGGALLQRCVDSLAAQTLRDFEAVVVDNNSSDDSGAALRLPDNRFWLHRSDSNLGFAAANNLGAAGCQAPFIALLNPDAFPEAEWLSQLRAATERYPWARVFGSTQLDASAPSLVDGCGDVFSVWGIAWRGLSGSPATALPDGDREVFSPCAAAALYARDMFERAGGLDESFFCYFEDVDLGFRLRVEGERCIQVRRAEVLHLGSAITGRASPFTVFHLHRNRIWLLAKNIPSPLIWLVLLLQLGVVPLLICVRPKLAAEALKGMRDGLLGLPRALRSRRCIQQNRRVSNVTIARAMSWDPRAVLQRSAHFIPGELGRD